MSESSSPMSATFVLLAMAGLWVVLLITMRAGITIPSPLAGMETGHSVSKTIEPVASAPVDQSGSTATEEIAADEYEVMDQMLQDYPRMTTLFEAAMVDGKITYQEAKNLLAQRDAMEKEAAVGERESARERLMQTIETMRSK